ncbi:sce7726 family protein [Winogradskyella luteola]|uniref:Sce7726 family protein n=1 Tax=Winogradskyella luteola TaxID=2828330 RepID=A0A9X1F8S4_9FLAO|nr:sce7726 family protein [Winogradskyella luteola]MBV7268693.1 sce7726 family protein [Winogradskyella luteola]
MRDSDIRRILRDTTLKKFILDSDSKVVDELNLPVTQSRIDIAVVNGHLHGYEIKSSRDTLNRLPHQIEGYTKVFDYLTVVTENKHYEKILEILPDWVGLDICVKTSSGYKIKTVRKSYYNRNKDGFFLAKLLWREEIENILKNNNISYSKRNNVWKLSETLGNNIPITKLSKIISETLKKRENWKIKGYYA